MRTVALFIALGATACSRTDSIPMEEVTFASSSESTECYDFLEVTMTIAKPAAQNPFTDVAVSGRFRPLDQGNELVVDGFCDSPDGRIFRIRFMPSKPGVYTYSVTYRRGNIERAHNGWFKVTAGRHGILRADAEHPWHFIWENSGEHFFLNGTTAFFLMGWDNKEVIRACIDRLSSLEVNRIRVLLDGRADHFWTEPIKPGHGFRAYLNPWLAKRPDDIRHPGFNYQRFDCSYWQKFEWMLSYARERGMIVSVIFGYNDTKVHPAADSEDERRYFHYAVARLAAFSNVTWDLGDDLDGFRSETWTHETGMKLYESDPYHHLATSHPVLDNQHQDRASSWFGMTSFQRWERPLHGWMLEQRRQQAKTGRIIPQLDEEYGYEDHYPDWAPYKAPAASADANRRAAWELVMAGCYQTTGETAKRGTGVAPDTGGGWVNGRGDSTMIMLNGYAHMVHFFTGFEWWKMEPHDELVDNGAYCLAESGRTYVVYLPRGGDVNLRLDPGSYQARWFNPRNGDYSTVSIAEGVTWKSPIASDKEDWVLLLTRIGGGRQDQFPKTKVQKTSLTGKRGSLNQSKLITLLAVLTLGPISEENIAFHSSLS